MTRMQAEKARETARRLEAENAQLRQQVRQWQLNDTFAMHGDDDGGTDGTSSAENALRRRGGSSVNENGGTKGKSRKRKK